MKLLFSEAPPDYAGYVFPWAVWGFPEPGEGPADALRRGFLPSLPDLSRWYLCRQVRVALDGFRPTSENRRILRRGAGISFDLLERRDFEWTAGRRAFCLDYAARRWSSPPAPERLDRVFASALTTHVAVFRDADGREAGLVSLLRDGGTWFYSNAFFDPGAASGLGAFLMTETVRQLAARGAAFLHLGTCYARGALYKTQFPGFAFFDGTGWNPDLAALKHLLARSESGAAGHLLEDPAYVERWIPQGLEAAAGAFGTR